MQTLLFALALTAQKPVHTEPGDIPRLKVAVDGKTVDLPLRHTHVKAEIEGYAARVTVTQKYSNPSKQPIEAIYVFPLPENSAVDGMTLVVGDRTIKAEIKKRADARQAYTDAKNQGKTAALLEQERPNVFTQSVANIAPGHDIDVVVSYLQDLTYDAGEYEFVFPMVVGPRFNPPGAQDTHINPPIMGEGTRNGHDISLEVFARAGLPIKGVDVPTHETAIIPTFDGSLRLQLVEKNSLPNRDFVMRYHVDGKEPEVTALSKGGYLTLLVHPPTLDIDKLVGSRELIFVVDVSGSMYGVPLAMCKDAMREALKGLRPTDTFNIYSFSGFTGSAFAAPRAANDANISDGLKYINALQAGGGTMMADAIKAALSPEIEGGRNRYVFFMTDGYVGNEARIIADTEHFVKLNKQKGGKSKVFGFGVGSSVNRFLIDGLGKGGEGLSVYATSREDPALAVNKFYRYIDSSILEDVSIDWAGLPVKDVYPRSLPDLFASHPLLVHARYDGSGSGQIVIRGTKNGKRVELPVKVTLDGEKQKTALATLWARSKIGDLERDLWNGEASNAVNAITELGLDYQLVTKYTSFIAIDHGSRVNEPAKTIVQPVHTPEGVDGAMAGGEFAALSGKGSIGGGMGTFGGTERGYVMPMATKAAPAERHAMVMTNDDEKAKNKKAEAKTPARNTVAGGLTYAQVEAVITAHKAELQTCKEANSGPIVLRFFITATGQVLQPHVEGCTLSISKWTFPSAAKNTFVTWIIRA